MKTNLVTGLIFFSIFTSAFADQDVKKTYSKVAADKVEVLIEAGDSVQAASFIDREETEKFLKGMLKDKNSKLSQLKSKLEIENCDTNSNDEESWIEGCGEVELTPFVQTSYGRGGWASAGAGYSFFVGFRSDGTGRFFEANYLVNFYESVEAIGEGENFDGKYLKTLELTSVKKID